MERGDDVMSSPRLVYGAVLSVGRLSVAQAGMVAVASALSVAFPVFLFVSFMERHVFAGFHFPAIDVVVLKECNVLFGGEHSLYILKEIFLPFDFVGADGLLVLFARFTVCLTDFLDSGFLGIGEIYAFESFEYRTLPFGFAICFVIGAVLIDAFSRAGAVLAYAALVA